MSDKYRFIDNKNVEKVETKTVFDFGNERKEVVNPQLMNNERLNRYGLYNLKNGGSEIDDKEVYNLKESFELKDSVIHTKEDYELKDIKEVAKILYKKYYPLSNALDSENKLFLSSYKPWMSTLKEVIMGVAPHITDANQILTPKIVKETYERSFYLFNKKLINGFYD